MTEQVMTGAVTVNPHSVRAQWRLIWSFAQRDLKARFTGTALGLVWVLIVPIATVVIYSFVFSVVFRAQAPPMGNGQPGNFAAWFLTGLVIWNLFAQATTGSLNSIEGMGAMLQKVFIPSYVPSLAATVTILVEKAMESLVLVLVLVYFMNVGWTWLLYPVLVGVLGVFAAAVGYMLAVANVHFRDTGQIYTIVMQLFFFLTPLMYPLEMVPESWNGVPLQQLILLNPLTSFVGIGRSLMYELTLPPANMVFYALGWTVVAAFGARFVYARWGRDVNEAI